MKEENINFLNLIKKIAIITWKIIYQLLILLIVLLTLIIVLQKASDNNKALGGYRIFKVISGSMLPKYNIGEVVICKTINPKEIKKGDDIVYLGKTGEINGKIIMHEVTDVKIDSNGKVKITAKGLDNTIADPVIEENQIYGVVVIKSELLTILYALANNIYSFFVIFIILITNVFISWKKDKFAKASEVKVLTEKNEDENILSKTNEKIEENKEENDKKLENEDKDETEN